MKAYYNLFSFCDILDLGLAWAINSDLIKTTQTQSASGRVYSYSLGSKKSRIAASIDDYLTVHLRDTTSLKFKKNILIFTCKPDKNSLFTGLDKSKQHANAYYIPYTEYMHFTVEDLNFLVEYFLSSKCKLFKDKRNVRVFYPTLSFETMISVINEAYSHRLHTACGNCKIIQDANYEFSHDSKHTSTRQHIAQFILEQLNLNLEE